MANAESVKIEFDAVMNLDNMSNNMKQLQNVLNQIKMPDELRKSFDKIFGNAEKEITNASAAMQKGFKDTKNITALDRSFTNINKIMIQLEKNIDKINQKDITASLTIDPTKIDELTTNIENLKAQMTSLAQNNGLEEVNKAIKEVAEVSKSKEFQKFGEAFATGDIVKAEKALKNLQDNTAKFKNGAPTEYVNTIELLKQKLEQLKGTNISDLTTQLSGLQDNLINIEKYESDNLIKEFDNTKNSVQQVTEETNKYGNTLIETARAENEASRELQNFGNKIKYFFSAASAVQLFKKAVREAFNTVKELDAVMTETAVVTDFSVSDMWAQMPTYSKMAKELGVSIKDAYAATTLYYQQGLKTDQALQLSNETLKMARIAGMDAAEATDRMTAALRGFNMELNETSAQRVNDVYSELAAITASDTDEISVAMTKTASIAHSAGMEFETTAAFLSQIIETTRESAETAGTAMKTVIARFQELKKSPSEIGEIEGEIVDANKIETALRTVGVALRDTDGQFRNLDEVFLDLAKKWDGLDKNTQRYIATIAAGSRQQSRFIAMMQDYDRTMELVTAANNSAGSSQRQYEKTLESLRTKLNQLSVAWDRLITGFANSDIIKGAVDMLTGFLDAINKILNFISGGNTKLKSFFTLFATVGAFNLGKLLIKQLEPTFLQLIEKFRQTGIKSGQAMAQGVQQGSQLGGVGFANSPVGKGLNKIGGKVKTGVSGIGTFFNYGGGFSGLRRAGQQNISNVTKMGTNLATATFDQSTGGMTQQESLNGMSAVNSLNNQLVRGQISMEEYKKGLEDTTGATVDLEKEQQTQAEITQQVNQSISATSMAAIGAGSSLLMLSGVFSNMGPGGEKLGKVLKYVGVGLMSFGTILPAVSTAFKIFGASVTTTIAGIPIIGWIAAAISALITLGMIFASTFESSAQKAKRLEEEMENAKQAAEETSQQLDELISAREGYDDLQNQLSNLTKGTKEWNQALTEANEKALELAKTYDLFTYLTKTDEGNWIISDEGWNEIIKKQSKEVEDKQIEYYKSQQKVAVNSLDEESKKYTIQKAGKDLQVRDIINATGITKDMSDDQIKQAIKNGPYKYLKPDDKDIQNIKDYFEFVENSSNASAAKNALIAQMDILIPDSIKSKDYYNNLMDAFATRNIVNNKGINPQLWSGKLKKYFQSNISSEKEAIFTGGSNLTREEANSINVTNVQFTAEEDNLFGKDRLEALRKQTDEAKNNFKKIDDSLASLNITASSFSNATLGVYDSFNSLITGVQNIAGDESATEFGNQLNDLVSELDNDAKESVLALANTVDWTSSKSIDEFNTKLYNLNEGLDPSAINKFTNAAKQLNSSVYKLTSGQLKTLNKEIGSIIQKIKEGQGDRTFTEEEYNKLIAANPDLRTQFSETLEGDYVYVGDSLVDLNNTLIETNKLMNEQSIESKGREVGIGEILNGNSFIKGRLEAGIEYTTENSKNSKEAKSALAPIITYLKAHGNYTNTELASALGVSNLDITSMTEDEVKKAIDSLNELRNSININTAELQQMQEDEVYKNYLSRSNFAYEDTFGDFNEQQTKSKNKALITQANQLGIARFEVEELKKAEEAYEENSNEETKKVLLNAQRALDAAVYIEEVGQKLKNNSGDVKDSLGQLEEATDDISKKLLKSKITSSLENALGVKLSDDLLNTADNLDLLTLAIEGDSEAWRQLLENILKLNLGLEGIIIDETGKVFIENFAGEIADLAKNGITNITQDEDGNYTGSVAAYLASFLTSGSGFGFGAGKGSGQRDRNSLDWLYNLVKAINSELRKRNELEYEYEKILQNENKDISSQVDKIKENRQKRMTNLLTEQELLRTQTGKRKYEIEEIQRQNNNLNTFAWFDEKLGEVQVNWDLYDSASGSKREQYDEYLQLLEDAVGKWQDSKDAEIENEKEQYELEQEGREDIISIEQRIYNAIVDERQKEIDNLSEINDSINDANSELLSKISEGVQEVREQRKLDKDKEELDKKQNQLALLMSDTSGANQLDILRTQKELDDARQSYTDSLIDKSINEMTKQNEEAYKQRQNQIELMQAQLEWDKENGVVSNQARSMLDDAINGNNSAIQNIVNLISGTENNKAMATFSAENWKTELNNSLASALAYGGKEGEGGFKKAIEDIIYSIPTTSQLSNSGTYKVQSGDGNDQNKLQELPINTTPIGSENYIGKIFNSTIGSREIKTTNGNADKIAIGNANSDLLNKKGKTMYAFELMGSTVMESATTLDGDTMLKLAKGSNSWWINKKDFEQFATGGLSTSTGPAWLDGTFSKPEYVLNATQTAAFLKLTDVLTEKDLNNNSMGNNYYNIEIQVDELANDYDVDDLAERVEERIVSASQYRNVNAVNLGRR